MSGKGIWPLWNLPALEQDGTAAVPEKLGAFLTKIVVFIFRAASDI